MQADRVDKSALGFDYQGKTEKHESQKGWSRLPGALRPPPADISCSRVRLGFMSEEICSVMHG